MSRPLNSEARDAAAWREDLVRLGAGFLVALLLNALLIPFIVIGSVESSTSYRWRQSHDTNEDTRIDPDKLELLNRLLPPPPKLRIGQDGSKASSLAWIAHDDFQELIAPKGQVPQPALQSMVDPQPQAAVRPDPSPPKPTAQASAAQQTVATQPSPQHTPAPQTGEQDKPASPPQPGLANDALAGAQRPDALPETDIQPMGQLALASPTGKTLVAPEPATHSGTPDKAQPKPDEKPDTQSGTKGQKTDAPPRPASAPSPASTASNAAVATTEPARPTSAPRSDRESAPVALNNSPLPIIPGRVIAGEGLEIKTVHPRFSTVATVSSIPRNPEARIVFDHKTGEVIEAELTRSSDYPNIDGPILASLYRWRAQGSRLKDFDKPIALKVHLILVDEN